MTHKALPALMGLRRRRRPTWADWLDLRRQRRALLRLEPRLLDDIGVSRAAALREARRLAWDAPAHWLR